MLAGVRGHLFDAELFLDAVLRFPHALGHQDHRARAGAVDDDADQRTGQARGHEEQGRGARDAGQAPASRRDQAIEQRRLPVEPDPDGREGQHAGAERHLHPGFLPVHVHDIRIFKLAFVSVCGAITQHQQVTLFQRNTAKLGVPGNQTRQSLNGRLKPHRFAGHRMIKPQNRRMQRLPIKTPRRLNTLLAQRLFRQLPPPPICRIANEAVPCVGQMHSDLMGTSGFQPALHQ